MKPSLTLEELKTSLAELNPPASLTNPLTALWWDAKGDWARAHDLLQDDNSPDGSWVHAYLHRKEPDPANAAYWYRRAGKPTASGDFESEWEAIVTHLLSCL
jgi:hypothetical protein